MLRYEKPKFVLIGSPDSRGEQWTWLQHRLEQDQAQVYKGIQEEIIQKRRQRSSLMFRGRT